MRERRGNMEHVREKEERKRNKCVWSNHKWGKNKTSE